MVPIYQLKNIPFFPYCIFCILLDYSYASTLCIYKKSLKKKTNDNTLKTNPTKWSNTLKQFVGCWATNYLRVFDLFVVLALKGLTSCLI